MDQGVAALARTLDAFRSGLFINERFFCVLFMDVIAGLLDWVFAEFGLWITVFFRHDDLDALPDVDAAPGLRTQRSICPRFAFITDPLITGVCAAKSRVRAISEGSIKRP